MSVSYADDPFTIVIAGTGLGPSDACIEMLGPFKLPMNLKVLGIGVGVHRGDENGTESLFMLGADTIVHSTGHCAVSGI